VTVSGAVLEETAAQEFSRSLWTKKEGFRSETVRVNRAVLRRGHINLTLKKEAVDNTLSASQTGAITGRVVDPDGKPLQSVKVLGGRGIWAGTDARGEYRIAKVIPGEYELRLSSRFVLVPSLLQKVVVEADTETRADFFVPDLRPYRVRITAKDEHGVPLANAKILVLEGYLGSGADRREVGLMEYSDDIAPRTGPDGSAYVFFREPNVEAVQVSVKLRFDHERYWGISSREGVPVVSGEAVVVCSRIPMCKKLVIRVVDAETGLPLSEYKYKYKYKSESHGGICRTANGEVHSQLDTGKITASIEKAGYLPAQKAITVEEGAVHKVEFLLSQDESK
jgi:hypothetical protein